MKKNRSRFQRNISSLMVVVMLFMQPVGVVFAEDPAGGSLPSADTTTTAPSAVEPTPPVTEPTPPDPASVTPPADVTPAPDPVVTEEETPAPVAASTSTTTAAPATGPTGPTGPGGPTGIIPRYAFNDAEQMWEPTITSSFTWSETAHNWVSPFYRYDPGVGWWHTISGVTPSDSIRALTANSGDPASLLQSILGTNGSSTSSTGPDSTNQAGVTDSQSVLITLLNNSGVLNNITSIGTSGDASVEGNTSGGDAKTGLVTIVSNLLNLLNAMWTFGSGGMSYFVENIYGDHTGDVRLNVQPAVGGGGQLGQCPAGTATNTTTGPGSTNLANYDCSRDLEVNNQTNGTIVNNVDLNATSGNATVSGNTGAGSATSGDVLAQLNIINLINTAIGAGQSFFGIINIFGNLNGDILFPGLGINGAVGSSSPANSLVSNTTTGPDSTNTASSSNTNSLEVNNEVQGSFNNNVTATATSGNATVSGNTEAGSATTGDTTIRSSLFNLFNTNIFGDNAVLVIVNNMGKWFGTIMNLGGAGESIGGLLTSNALVQNSLTGPDSTNQASVSTTNTAEINNRVNGSITNNVDITAVSGDATVSNNTQAGNATSGNATIASSIANIFNSTLSFGKVFGVLFINVFGSWTGNAGLDTDAGTIVIPLAQLAPSSAGASSFAAGLGGNTNAAAGHGAPVAAVGSAGSESSTGSVAATGAHTVNASLAAADRLIPQAAQTATENSGMLIVLAAVLMLMAGGAISLERKLSRPGQSRF